MRIESSGKPVAATATTRARRKESGFTLPDSDAPAATDEAAEPAAAQSVALVSLAGLAPQPDPVADREAAAQGGAMLDALAGLQRALLEGNSAAAGASLATLARTLPGATDPALDAVLQSVALRAAVERARSE
jgi:hypothetical protein